MRKLATIGLLLGAGASFFQGQEPARNAAEKPGVFDTSEKDYVKVSPVTYGPWHSSVIGGGGYLQNVVVSSDPKILYSYVDVGGIYRSDDAGQNWRMLHGALPAGLSSTEVRGCVVDPRNPDHVIIAHGSQYGPKGGISVSKDGGKSWEKKLEVSFSGNGPARAAGFLLVQNPRNLDELALAAIGDGVWFSKDNGQTWTASGGAKDLYPLDLDYDRANPQRLWVCASNTKFGKSEYKSAFLRTDDGGATWTKLSDTSPGEIIQDPVDAKCLYGIFGAKIIRRSLDGGSTWEDFSTGLELKDEDKKPSITTSGYGALAAGPDFILTANKSNSTFFKLKSGESTWQRIEKEKVTVGDWYGPTKGNWFFGGALGSITVDQHDPTHWFLTDYFAIYQTHDAGKTWALTINGIEVTVTHCLTQDPADPAVVHVGEADTGSVTSLNAGLRFHKDKVPDEKDAKSGGKNMKCIDLSPKLPNRLYAVGDRSYTDGWLANQIFISVDRGATWSRSPMVGINAKNQSITSIAADLNDPYTVYCGMSGKVGPNAGGVYKSTDGGARWTWMGEGLKDASWFFPNEIWAHGRQIAAGPDGKLIVISSQSNLCYRFDPAAGKWEHSPLEIRGKVWSVVADRLKAGRYFAGVRGGGLFRTDDAGLTWKKVYDKSVSYVATDTAVADRVAAGTGDGVILSKDGGDTWQELDKALPYRADNIPCFAGERLLVGSGGSGVFWMALSPAGEKPLEAKPLVLAAVPPAEGKLPDLGPALKAGDSVPEGWQQDTDQLVNLEIDANEVPNKEDGLASLNFKTDALGSKGSVYREFVPTLSMIKFAGSIRAKGQFTTCKLAVQFIDEKGNALPETVLAEPAGQKWFVWYDKTVAIPPQAAKARFALALEGSGDVFLSNARVDSPPALYLQ